MPSSDGANVFLAPKKGAPYWFRKDVAEEARHMSLLRETERLHLACGHNIRPRVDITTDAGYTTGSDGGTDDAKP